MLENILSILTALTVLAIGLFFTWLAFKLIFEQFRAWRLARQSLAWGSVIGQIESSELTFEGTRSPRSQPSVRYHYRVYGTDYYGQRIDFSFAPFYFRQQTEEILARYPVHAQVTVFFDPAEPAECALEQRQKGGLGGLLLGLFVFMPACLCLATGLIGLSDTLGK